MPNSLQSSAIASPASRRATNCSLSSMTEHSFQGITPSSLEEESVTHVSGTKCHLCLRPLRTYLPLCSHAHRLSVLSREPRISFAHYLGATRTDLRALMSLCLVVGARFRKRERLPPVFP